MSKNSVSRFLFRTAIGIVIVGAVLAILRAPLGSILFDAEGAVRWMQLGVLITIEVVFISILLSDERAFGSLVVKTLLFAGLVALFTTGLGMEWMTASTGQVSSAAVGRASDGNALYETIRIMHVPFIMLVLFGFWFLRTALWPALAR